MQYDVAIHSHTRDLPLQAKHVSASYSTIINFRCRRKSISVSSSTTVFATPQPLTQLWFPPAVNKLAVVLRHGAARAAALCDKIDESIFGDAVQLLQRSPEHERVHTPSTSTNLQNKMNKAATGGICDEDGEGEARRKQVNVDERGRNRYCRSGL